MFCPNRDCPNAEATGEPAEYREGIVVCAACGATLVGTAPDWPEDVVAFEAFVPVTSLEGAAMVSFAKSLLQGAGIRFYVQNEAVQDLFGVGRFGTGFSAVTGAPVVLVEPSRAEEARELLATMDVDPEFSDFRRRVTRFERASGYYIIDLVSIEAMRDAGKTQEDILESVLESFDDEPWRPPGEGPSKFPWEHHAVSASEAAEEVVAALVGGKDISHAGNTMSPETARKLWKELVTFFAEDPRYYVGMGLGDRDHAFLRGVVIMDEERAGILWVVEGD